MLFSTTTGACEAACVLSWQSASAAANRNLASGLTFMVWVPLGRKGGVVAVVLLYTQKIIRILLIK